MVRERRFLNDFQRDEEFDEEVSEDADESEPQIGETGRALEVKSVDI